MKINREKSKGFERITSSQNLQKAALVGLLLITMMASGCSVSDPNTIEISSRDLPPIPMLTPTPTPEVDYKIYEPGKHKVFTSESYAQGAYGDLIEYNTLEVPEGYERVETIFEINSRYTYPIIVIETFKNTVEVKVEAKEAWGQNELSRAIDGKVYETFGTPTGNIALETTGPVKEKSADFKRN